MKLKKLGKLVIDCDNRQVNYFEQSFNDTHILAFEFLDDKFRNLRISR